MTESILSFQQTLSRFCDTIPSGSLSMHRDRQRLRQGHIKPRPKSHKSHKRTKRGLALAAAAIAVVAVVIGKIAMASPPPTHSAKPKSTGVALASVAKKPAAINQTVMASQINQDINASDLETGVSIIDLTNNQRYDYGLGDTQYIAASTTKVLSASLFLHDVELGQDSLSQPLGGSTAQAEMQKMIVVSDDTAWEDFNDLLGHPALLAYAQSLGMKSYDPDNNLINSDDLATLLADLYQGKLLDSQHTNLLLGYMAQADYAQYIG